jgi:hypothetical protein
MGPAVVRRDPARVGDGDLSPTAAHDSEALAPPQAGGRGVRSTTWAHPVRLALMEALNRWLARARAGMEQRGAGMVNFACGTLRLLSGALPVVLAGKVLFGVGIPARCCSWRRRGAWLLTRVQASH